MAAGCFSWSLEHFSHVFRHASIYVDMFYPNLRRLDFRTRLKLKLFGTEGSWANHPCLKFNMRNFRGEKKVKHFRDLWLKNSKSMSFFKISDKEMISKFQVHSFVITVFTGISGQITKAELLKGIRRKRIPPYPTHRQKKEDGPRVTNQDLVNTSSCKRRLIWSDLPKANLLHNKHFTQNPAGLEWWILVFFTPNRFSFSFFNRRFACHKVTGWMEIINLKGPLAMGGMPGCREIPNCQTKPNPDSFVSKKTECFDETTSLKVAWLTKITESKIAENSSMH